MMDLFYADIRGAYSYYTRPSLCKLDHNLVFLSSTYKLIVQRQFVTKITVRSWSEEAEDNLLWCFEATG